MTIGVTESQAGAPTQATHRTAVTTMPAPRPVFALDASTGADDNYLQRFAGSAGQPNRRQPSNKNPGKEPDGTTEQQGPISHPGGSFSWQ